MLRVAVVGSGPAGIYTAEALTRAGGASVDVVDRLPAPYGLVRYGVAPDHLKIKSIAAALQKVLEGEHVRFLGNVELGADVDVADLRRCYDAVVYAYGASVDRRLGVRGEDLPGSFSATEFVAWYCGHPDAAIDRFTLDATAVAVVGVGNVAVDVARMLTKPIEGLRTTDLSDHVLDVLARSSVADVSVLGRRGPAQAKFTTKELRELGEIAGVDVVVRPDELLLDEASEAAVAAQPVLRRNLETLREWAARPLTGAPRRLHLRFLLRPVELLGAAAVSGVRLRRTALTGTGQVVDAADEEVLDAQMVLRSVGYRGSPLPGLPFDQGAGVIPNDAGRVLRDGSVAPGEYVVGWIKRGPTGVIGTNKHDAQETVASLLADADNGRLPRVAADEPDPLLALLAERGVQAVTYAGWEAIDAAERALGATQGRARVKIANRAELLSAAGRLPLT
ncbi:MAG: FAD-dependent oxidoreductase [Actinomycetota bacterium]|nr:FAD-dependent oxidoreductase [Actinomycetota bacterium]